MNPAERETRDVLKEVGELSRYNGGHEVWRLPDGSAFPLPARGRRGASGRTWLNIRANLRRKLRNLGLNY